MKEIEIRELFRNTEAYADQEVLVQGWVRSNRSSNQFGFLSINDGSFFSSVQVVYEASKLSNYQEVAKYRLSAGVSVRGTVVLTPEAKQPFEIKADEIILEADSDPDYPLQKKRHTMEFLREIAHLRILSRRFSESEALRLMRSTSFSRRRTSYTSTLLRSRAVTVKAPARCSR